MNSTAGLGTIVDLRALVDHWWAIAVRGVVSIVFGVLTLALPTLTLTALIFMFGAYALVEGLFALIAAIRGRQDGPRRALLLEGLVSVAAGIVTFVLPGLSALALAYVIAGWGLVTGALKVAAAIRLREEVKGEWALVLSGVLSLIFGVLMASAPTAGALTVVLVIGAYAIAFGALLLVLAFRLRRVQHQNRVPLARAA
jgi:uncharacterized membrane protein HdeD (DUF308 family)